MVFLYQLRRRKRVLSRLQFLWAMKRLVLPLVCSAFILIIVKNTALELESLHRDSEHRHASFVEHRNAVLDARMITSTKVFGALHCASMCLDNDQCISYNSAVFPDVTGKFDCQLLATDKYRFSRGLRPSKTFNYYNIMVRTFNDWRIVFLYP